MPTDKISINIQICGRYYPLNIEPVHEELIRMAAKLVNERAATYREKFVDKDAQDTLSMTALEYTVKLLESQKNKDESQLISKISELNDKLDLELSE